MPSVSEPFSLFHKLRSPSRSVLGLHPSSGIKVWPTVHVVCRLGVRVVNQRMVHILEVVAYPLTEPHLLHAISISEAQL